MQRTITVYRSADVLRVVAGEHVPHAGSKACRVSVYPSAELAYATEDNVSVRAAIIRIAPDVRTDARVTFIPASSRQPRRPSAQTLERSDIREAAIQSIADERAPNDEAPITEAQIQCRMSAMRKAGKGNDWTPYEQDASL